MDGSRFDAATRSLAKGVSRRLALAGMIGALATPSRFQIGVARKKKKKPGKKSSPLRLNQFGCVDVGSPCRGNGANCCSGLCQGVKPRPGKKDSSRCVGHNEDSCTPARNRCTVADPASAACNPANAAAFCTVTTGNGVFCASNAGISEANCRPCARDSDCTAAGFPVGSACIVVSGGGPGCVGLTCVSSGGRACAPPGI
jgi:hypothetical protein